MLRGHLRKLAKERKQIIFEMEEVPSRCRVLHNATETSRNYPGLTLPAHSERGKITTDSY